MILESIGRSLDCWINIQQITHESVLLRYSHKEWLAPVAAELSDGKNTCRQEQNGNLAGRFFFDGLTPDTAYTVKVTVEDKTVELKFNTLPAEPANKLFQLAIFSDTHISTKLNASHGRLHGESCTLLRSLMQKAALSADYIVGPGDMADGGQAAEFAELAASIKRVNVPVLAVPGNHDVVHGGDVRFLELFKQTTFLFEHKGIQLAGLDTGNGHLNKDCNRAIVDAIDPNKPLLLFSHFQLFADDWIPDADKVIFDPDECTDMLDKIKTMHALACIGHKNVATQLKINNYTQINMPQLTHFPAGYLVIDVYPGEFRLRFEPIPSEILNEYSRVGTEMARYHAHPGCQLKGEYRDHYTDKYWNCVVKTGISL